MCRVCRDECVWGGECIGCVWRDECVGVWSVRCVCGEGCFVGECAKGVGRVCVDGSVGCLCGWECRVCVDGCRGVWR